MAEDCEDYGELESEAYYGWQQYFSSRKALFD